VPLLTRRPSEATKHPRVIAWGLS